MIALSLSLSLSLGVCGLATIESTTEAALLRAFD